MALGKNCSTKMKHVSVNSSNFNRVDEALGIVRRTGAMGKKRILVSNYKCLHDSPFGTPLKKPYNATRNLNSERSILESVPQDILVRILCGVDHEDLDQLFHVSKSIREAALIAKRWHFAFCTPSKTASSRPLSNLEEASEAPNAPKQERCYRTRMSGKKLADITVALFHSPEEEQWTRSKLGREM